MRIATNYLRLLLTLMMGLALVPILLHLVGDVATGLIGFLGASVGLAAMAQEIARDSMIRELGEAHHGGDPLAFRRVYNSSIIISACGGILTTGLFAVLYLILPVLSIPVELIGAVQVFLIAKAVQSFFEILFSPQLNMLLVFEKMAVFNVYQVLHRSMLLIAAGILVFTTGDSTIAHRLAAYGIVTSLLQTLCIVSTAVFLIWRYQKLRPSLKLATRTTLGAILGSSGWNLLISVSVRLHERIGSILMNVFFGPIGNLIFDAFSFRMASYVRMAASGMTTGVDAIATRLQTTEDKGKLEIFLLRSTKLHAIATFPTAVFAFTMADPLLTVWIGRYVENSETVLPIAVWMLRILLIGISVRCISDGWLRIFYGAGYINSYAPLIFAGGILSPIIGCVLYYVLPENKQFYCVAISLSLLLLIFNGLIAPMRCSRLIGIPTIKLYSPLVAPAVISLAGAVGLSLTISIIDRWTLAVLSLTLVLYGFYSITMTAFFVLTKADRQKLIKVLCRSNNRI